MYVQEFTETCGRCGKEFTGQKVAGSKEELDKTGWWNAVEETLLLETCHACLDLEKVKIST